MRARFESKTEYLVNEFDSLSVEYPIVVDGLDDVRGGASPFGTD